MLLKLFLFAFLLIGCIGSKYGDPQPIILKHFSNKVKRNTKTDIKENEVIPLGASIITEKDSRAELELKLHSFLHIHPQSEVKFLENKTDLCALELVSGSFEGKTLSEKKLFSISVGNKTIGIRLGKKNTFRLTLLSNVVRFSVGVTDDVSLTIGEKQYSISQKVFTIKL